jgi:hypothetical protein
MRRRASVRPFGAQPGELASARLNALDVSLSFAAAGALQQFWGTVISQLLALQLRPPALACRADLPSFQRPRTLSFCPQRCI